MDAVVNILDVGERQKVVQPVGGVILRKFNLTGFDAIDNAYVQAIIAHDFHVLFDLIGRNHSGATVLAFKETPVFRLSSGSYRYGLRKTPKVLSLEAEVRFYWQRHGWTVARPKGYFCAKRAPLGSTAP
jgi:hypothetical protein